MNEWIEEAHSPKGKLWKRRRSDLLPAEVEQLEEQSKTNMAKQTRWALKCFKDWCQDKGVVIHLKTVSKQQVSNALRLL